MINVGADVTMAIDKEKAIKRLQAYGDKLAQTLPSKETDIEKGESK